MNRSEDRQIEALQAAFLACNRRSAPVTLIHGWRKRLRQGEELANLIIQLAGAREEHSQAADHSEALEEVYKYTVGRTPSQGEMCEWAKYLDGGLRYWQLFLNMALGEEGRTRHSIALPLDASDSERIVCSIHAAHILVVGEGAEDAAVEEWRSQISDNDRFLAMIKALAGSAGAERRASAESRETISLIYRCCLNREPHPAEMDAWCERVRTGFPLTDVLQSVHTSVEGKSAQTARLTELKLRQEVLVKAVYELTVKRTPSLDEVVEWSAFLAAGLGESEFMLKMAFSQEAGPNFPPELRGPAAPEERLALGVSAVFAFTLGRLATEEEIRLWLPALESGRAFATLIESVAAASGVTLKQRENDGAFQDASSAAAGSGGSNSDPPREAEAIYPDEGAALTWRTQLIVSVYKLTVGRAAEQSEIDEWLALLAGNLADNEFVLNMALGGEALSKRSFHIQEPESEEDRLPFVARFVFQVVCGRAMSEDEAHVWSEQLRRSRSFLDFMALLEESPEARAGREQSLRSTVELMYRVCLHRDCSASEADVWLTHFRSGLTPAELLQLLYHSEEAQTKRRALLLNPELGNPDFIQAVYQIVLHRGAAAFEVQVWADAFSSGDATREDFLRGCFEAQLGRINQPPVSVDPSACWIMGTTRTITTADWVSACEASHEERGLLKQPSYRGRFEMKPHISGRPKISAIASLYNGKSFIKQFLNNITEQSVFEEACELIIIDANSPENEYEDIAPFLDRYPNIIYRRMDYRIGIYDAWNVGISMARGDYITNTNLDDLRRADSLELQAACLDALDFVDIVYQDFFYSLQPDMQFAEVRAINLRSELPLVTRHNLALYNSPHNAPMWRKDLHRDIGFFDTSFKSAGDYDFWLRCITAEKVFYKLNEPHVVYYHNPQGLSTQAETRGIDEGHRVTRRHASDLLKHLTFNPSRRAEELGVDISTLKGRRANPTEYDVIQAALVQLAANSARC